MCHSQGKSGIEARWRKQRVVRKPRSGLETVKTFLVPTSTSELDSGEHRVEEVVTREK